jgi:predicted metal-dependent phosphoesterase TrpH
LDGIAITDHDTIEGARDFQRWIKSKNLKLQIIVGEEKTLADGTHFIGLFLQEPISSATLTDAIKEIEGQGGLCMAPHPFRRKDGVLRDGLATLPVLQQHRVAFELFNGKSSAADNTKARGLLDAGLPPFAGSDAHYESDLGESLNVIPWDGDLRTSVERMLRAKGPCRLFGRPQSKEEPERAYAPLYYRMKRFVRLPKPLVPVARQVYRAYRNRTVGVGRKPLVEIYTRT